MPLHSLQGNLTFHGGSKGLTIGGEFGVTVAQFASHLSDFFFFFIIFFFFIASWLLDFKLSPGKLEEEGEEIGEESERSTMKEMAR